MNEILDKLIEWVQEKHVDHAINDTGNTITKVLLGLVAIVAAAFLYYRAWKQGKELAKLQHEKDVLEEKSIQKVTKDKIDQSLEAISKLKQLEISNLNKISIVDLQLKKLDEERTKTKNEIESLETWSDINRYLDQHK